MKRCAYLSLVLMAVLASSAWARTWTSQDGRRIEGDFVDATDEKITLKKPDGTQTTFKLELLSDEDQRFVRGLLLRRKGTKPATPAADDPFSTPTPTPKPGANKIPKFGASEEEDEDADPDNPFGSSGSDSPTPGKTAKKGIKIENRTWTDAFGRNKSSGKFLRFQGNNVIVLRAGRQATFDYWSLSTEDQDYLKEMCESYGQSHLIPKEKPTTVAGSPMSGVPGSTPAAPYAPGYPVMPMGSSPPSTPRSVPTPAQTANPEELARRLREIQNNPPSTTYTPPPSTTFNPPASTPSSAYSTPMPGYTPPASTPSSAYSTPSSAYSTPMPGYTPPSSTYTPPPAMTPSSAFSTPANGYNPTPMPSMPSSNFGSPGTGFDAKQCGSCRKVLPASFTAGDTCPGCGIVFSHDETNGKTANVGWGSGWGGGGGGAGGGGLSRGAIRGIIVLVVLGIKAIAFMAWRSQQS